MSTPNDNLRRMIDASKTGKGSTTEWIDDTGTPALRCEIVNIGWWCGYVGVPPGHPLHGRHFRDCSKALHEAAHGGLTFSGLCGKDDQTWWLGFDCMHWFDVKDPPSEADVRASVERLAAAVREEP